ncbi:hypothetical protein A2818_00775 [Candidatus Nomurabacteria bacterium RIFCSPHIGHO2_01_FULL_40_12]|uniref:Uncharacterized protein n=1 Tax=Candidatus Nomurabacteria bacterium RIFCSPHIGHO2_01_FULL_40_12 TaxID=1801737 RepID=A0A1F6V1C9_9BACT|nr:MAG: hypothetical protein A2818_00775 [Candidatus Nomurabacteria bacterium RIFCSPHIGHO2_01_FULL_40_12]
MEQNFQTSFIPKKPIIAERATVSRPVGFLMIVSIFILFTVLVATAGLYFYKGIVAKNLAVMERSLIQAKNRFEPSKITELQVLDKRLRAANEILSQHISITPVFEALEAVTMKNVRYTKFNYNLGEGKDAKVIIKMSGLAVGYRSVALQSELFATNIITNNNFIDPVFSNLALDNNGNVLFDLEFSVDPSFVDYKQMLENSS